MIDSGSTITLVSQSLLKIIGSHTFQPSNSAATLGDGKSKMSTIGEVEFVGRISHTPTTIRAKVTTDLVTDLILGNDWIHKYQAIIDHRHHCLHLHHPRHGNTSTFFLNRPRQASLRQDILLPRHSDSLIELIIPDSLSSSVVFTPYRCFSSPLSFYSHEAVLSIKEKSSYAILSNRTPNARILKAGTHIGTVLPYEEHSQCPMFKTSNNNINPGHTLAACQTVETTTPEVSNTINSLTQHLKGKDRADIENILTNNSRLFDTSKPTQAKLHTHHIIPTGDHPPVNSRPFYRTVAQRKDCQNAVAQLLLDKVIRPSKSPWSSPVFLKKKPDGTFRFLVDYRKLNAVTKKDCYPHPSAEELLNRLARHRVFTKLDLKSGYFQIPIAERDKEKTAFITQDGLYEFNVLPQGLMNAPPTFQRAMNETLATGRWDFIVVYLDDIIIFSKTMEEHKEHLSDVLSTLNKAHFQVSPAKCQIAQNDIEFLAHKVSYDSV